MAGIGIDAVIMEGTDPTLKQAVGSRRVLRVRGAARQPPGPAGHHPVDDEPPFSRKAHVIVIGNVGFLQGNIQLIPDARADDGLLDVLVASPRGLRDWVRLTTQVLTRQKRTDRQLDRLTGRKVSIKVDGRDQYQMDGDTVGECSSMTAEVRPGALRLRVPRDSALTVGRPQADPRSRRSGAAERSSRPEAAAALTRRPARLAAGRGGNVSCGGPGGSGGTRSALEPLQPGGGGRVVGVRGAHRTVGSVRRPAGSCPGTPRHRRSGAGPSGPRPAGRRRCGPPRRRRSSSRPRLRLVGRDSIRHRLTPRLANCSRISSSAPGWFSRMNSTMVVLSAPVGGPSRPGRGDQHEPGDRVRVVGDALGQRGQPVHLAGHRAQIAASKRDSGSATSAAAAAVDPPSVTSASRQVQSQPVAALGGGVRVGQDVAYVVQRVPGRPNR